MRALITGISGFVGRHVAEGLRAAEPDVELYGLVRWRTDEDELRARLPGVRLVEGDLVDAPSLRRALEAARPDVVYHLAASSSVSSSWVAPVEMMHVNVLGTLQLLETVRELAPETMVVLACSAEPYGRVEPERLPIGEDEPFRPLSPYAVSKAAVDHLGFQYHCSHGLRTVRLRLFNQCGPGQPDRFVVSALARQVAEAEAGVRPPRLAAGDFSVRRDFLDVRDAARAWVLAARLGVPGAAYNVATGVARSIREVADALAALARCPLVVDVDPARLRPVEVPVLLGDASRFRAATGWAPEIPFERTLADVLGWWRQRVGRR